MDIHCGSELARDGGSTFNINVTEKPLSRASSLPQGFVFASKLRVTGQRKNK
jgi:hypothetical protein